MSKNMLKDALNIANAGVPIIPCIPTGEKAKAPYISNGFHGASADAETVQSWWITWPDALIGTPIDDDLIVLDIDPRNGGSLEALEAVTGPLPKTLTAWSGRGDNGRHLYFKKPAGDVSARKLPKGVDLKLGGKGYVIAPPSLHPATGQPYKWGDIPAEAELPQQALQALQPPKPATPPTMPAPFPSASNSAGLVRTVAEAVEGERNHLLFWSACRAFDANNPELVQELFDAALNVGLTENEATATIGSAERTKREPVQPFTPRAVDMENTNHSASLHSDKEKTDGSDGSDGYDGYLLGPVLNRLNDWLARFIRTTTPLDINLLTLWCAHTYVAQETYSSPRLQVDALMRGSGKTTVLEHMQHLAHDPVQAASISSPALLARMLSKGIRTILIDEVDRSLKPDKPGVEDLIAILNSGYKRGATRPVLVPGKNGEWDVDEMSTYSPVAMAGNAPNLPEDTRSRSIRVLLMPDTEGTVEPSDWEDIETPADELKTDLTTAMDACRGLVKQSRPELPEGCTGRTREKWNPLARVADVAGGQWPGIVAELITNDMKEAEMEKEDGLANLPKSVHLLHDLAETWHDTEPFLQTKQILARLQTQFPYRWSTESPTGKRLTVQGMGRMLSQMKIYSDKDVHDVRGYYRNQFGRVFRQFNLDHLIEPSKPSEQSEPSRLPGIESCALKQ